MKVSLLKISIFMVNGLIIRQIFSIILSRKPSSACQLLTEIKLLSSSLLRSNCFQSSFLTSVLSHYVDPSYNVQKLYIWDACPCALHCLSKGTSAWRIFYITIQRLSFPSFWLQKLIRQVGLEYLSVVSHYLASLWLCIAQLTNSPILSRCLVRLIFQLEICVGF